MDRAALLRPFQQGPVLGKTAQYFGPRLTKVAARVIAVLQIVAQVWKATLVSRVPNPVQAQPNLLSRRMAKAVADGSPDGACP
jgi:hypothetical protein